MELKLLSLSEDDKLIRECMEQASAFYGCLGKMGVTEILCDRKKAQELGADCQITGIFTGGELTAFACAFEYTGLKRNGRKWLNPGDKEWRQIETLGTNVVVIPLLVGKEKVGRLIELLREQYRDSHLLFRISGEQSEKFQEDLAVVSEKNLKSHRYDAAGENVWLFHFAPQIRMEDTYFEEEILLILPGQEVLLEMGIEEAEVTMVKLTGYEIVRSEKGSAFFRKPGAACEGVLLQCDYEQLLRYQRFINLTNYEEHFEQTDRGKALIYSEKYQSDSSLLWNDLLREMVKTRKAEWSIVPDSYIMYPVTYKEQDRLLECACYDNQEIGNYMHYMDIRLQCETGVPFGKDGIDLMERYKNRLERIPLGRLRVRITLEMILDILDHEDQPVGCDAEAEAVLSIDRLSHIGVLTLVSLSTPFLLSHFLDNIVRNQLMVIEENGEAVNLYAYMQEKWGLNASGTPKSYEMIPKEKNCLNKKQLGAVLLSETIYEEGEDFGEFTDAEILKLTNSETGMGQYSRAFVVAHTNVLLDFEKDLRGTIQARMYNAAFTCFYVELLMFEEAALTCFNKELIDLMAEVIRWLKVKLAPCITIHGVLVDVFGEGVLIMGESGIGKSEAALELIKRGHRLITDDVVEIHKVSDDTLVGTSPEITRHFIELRGIGIIDAKTLFGVESVKNTQTIDLVIKLEEWDKDKEYDRLGLQEEYTEFLGNRVVCHSIPIRPGRSLAVIVESAAVNHRQKKMGYNAAQELYNRVQKSLAKKKEEQKK